MELLYLLFEHQRYDNCKLIKLSTVQGEITLYLPPYETGQYTLDEIIDECITFQLNEFPGSRIDHEGKFYQKLQPGTGSRSGKNILNHVISIPQLLQRLQTAGYEIPNNYWTENRNNERIRKMSSCD
jgi:hypothetical protein